PGVMPTQDLKDRPRMLQGHILSDAICSIGVFFVLPSSVVIPLQIFIVTREQPIEIFWSRVAFRNDMRSIGVVGDVVLEPQIIFDHVIDKRAQQYNVSASTNGDVLIRNRGSTGKARVNVNYLGTTLLRFGNTLESNRLAFGHVGTLNQNQVCIRHILQWLGGTATPKRRS